MDKPPMGGKAMAFSIDKSQKRPIELIVNESNTCSFQILRIWWESENHYYLKYYIVSFHISSECDIDRSRNKGRDQVSPMYHSGTSLSWV